MNKFYNYLSKVNDEKLIDSNRNFYNSAELTHLLSKSYLTPILNSLNCVASNAQIIKLQYSSDFPAVEGDWNDTLPEILLVANTTERMEDNHVMVTLLESFEYYGVYDDHIKWNGYYRCYASTTTDTKTYITVSPPIRIVFPAGILNKQ